MQQAAAARHQVKEAKHGETHQRMAPETDAELEELRSYLRIFWGPFKETGYSLKGAPKALRGAPLLNKLPQQLQGPSEYCSVSVAQPQI